MGVYQKGASTGVDIRSVVIPDSVTTIGENAFALNSNLIRVTMSSGLTSITIEATTPPALGGRTFFGSTCPIYVPDASVNAYKSDWFGYASRIQAIP